jgi:hypothetical protein
LDGGKTPVVYRPACSTILATALGVQAFFVTINHPFIRIYCWTILAACQAPLGKKQ